MRNTKDLLKLVPTHDPLAETQDTIFSQTGLSRFHKKQCQIIHIVQNIRFYRREFSFQFKGFSNIDDLKEAQAALYLHCTNPLLLKVSNLIWRALSLDERVRNPYALKLVMTHLQKLRTLSSLKWVSLDFTRSNVKSSLITPCPKGLYRIAQNTRFYRRKSSIHSEGCSDLDDKVAPSVSRVVRKEAQAALLEYLHTTRNISFMDAEHMSRNSPIFLGNFLKRVDVESEIGRSIARFLRYHPINEFEPFFESIGLKPLEYSPFLPPKLMFLEDDAALLENYHVLCNYGIPRNSIGKIYKAAEEVFRYDHGVLQVKLQAFRNVGLNRSAIVRIVSSSPGLLIGDRSTFLCKVIEKLKSIGIGSEWIEGRVWEEGYNWSHILELLHLLNTMVCNEEQLRKIICHCPAFLFEGSGNTAFSFLGFLLKFGTDKCDISSIFLKLPQVQASKFLANFRGCYMFLVDIHMEVDEIGKFVRSHPVLLGSCSLKKLSSLIVQLKAGKKRICDIVKENPEVLKEWVYRSRVRPLPKLVAGSCSEMMRTKFLLDLGFSKNSNEIQKTLKQLRGDARALQERFDAFVTAGFSRNDVTKMIEIAPNILNLSKDLIEMKINFVVNELGFPLSSLVESPEFFRFTIQRVKLRVSMYLWLRDHGSVGFKHLGTVLARSEERFIRWYVNKHPDGLLVWEGLKNKIYTDSRVHLSCDSNPCHKLVEDHYLCKQQFSNHNTGKQILA